MFCFSHHWFRTQPRHRWPFSWQGPKLTEGDPGWFCLSQATTLIPPEQSVVPSRCGCKGVHIERTCPEQNQAAEGQKPGGPVMFTPQVEAGWWMWSVGGALSPRAILSPEVTLISPVWSLCRHRAGPDPGAECPVGRSSSS